MLLAFLVASAFTLSTPVVCIKFSTDLAPSDLSFSQLNLWAASPSHHVTRQTVLTDLPGDWGFFGCFEDNPDVPGVGRSLSGASFTNATGMTIEACVNFCISQLFIFAGLEFGQQCFCDNIFEHIEESVGNDECDQPCVGNPAELCGAANRLSVYTSNTPAVFPSLVPSVGPWVSLGCFNDTDTARALQRRVNAGNVTVESCTAACQNETFTLAGLEIGQECWCGSRFLNGSIFVGNSNGINGNPPVRQDGMTGMFCSMGCVGNTSELCGGPQRLNVYNFTGPFATTVPSVGGWVSIGCFTDSLSARTLSKQVHPSGGVTAESCTTECLSSGFPLAGLEFGDECWCNATLPNTTVIAPTAPASACDMPCTAASLEICGGPLALTVYQFVDVSTLVDILGGMTSSTLIATALVNNATPASAADAAMEIIFELDNNIDSFVVLNLFNSSALSSPTTVSPIVGPNNVVVMDAYNTWANAVGGLSTALISQSSILATAPLASGSITFGADLISIFIDIAGHLNAQSSADDLSELFVPSLVTAIGATTANVVMSLEQALVPYMLVAQ